MPGKSLVEDQNINDKIIILGDTYWVFLCVCVCVWPIIVLSLIHFAHLILCIYNLLIDTHNLKKIKMPEQYDRLKNSYLYHSLMSN